jgi:hypothetical protein
VPADIFDEVWALTRLKVLNRPGNANYPSKSLNVNMGAIAAPENIFCKQDAVAAPDNILHTAIAALENIYIYNYIYIYTYAFLIKDAIT